MKIKLTEPILDYEGNKIPIADKKGGYFDVRLAIVNAINYFEQDKAPLAEEKAKVYGLSVKVYGKNEVDFTVDELAFIKQKAGEALTAVAYGRLLDIIDPQPAEPSKG